ncbi:MAG: hypothetical protein R3B47_15440 [Bacteroidia bacterium]
MTAAGVQAIRKGRGPFLSRRQRNLWEVFDNGIREKGLLRTADGAEFSGSWKHGKLEGEARRWPIGSSCCRCMARWEGALWFWDLPGRKLNPFGQTGTKAHPTPANGRRTARWSRHWPDGKVYVGEWVSDVQNGRPGTLKWPTAAAFAAAGKKGRYGEGTFVDRFGNDFAGDWRGTPESITRRLLRTGRDERGAFVDGRYERVTTFSCPGLKSRASKSTGSFSPKKSPEP